HVAFVRLGSGGAKFPTIPEVTSLAAYLDGRRDTTVPLCVCAGAVTILDLRGAIVISNRRLPWVVAAAVEDALGDVDSPLVAANRTLGEALDRSDVLAVIHTVRDVLGVTSLSTAAKPTEEFDGCQPDRWELLVIGSDPLLQVAPA